MDRRKKWNKNLSKYDCFQFTVFFNSPNISLKCADVLLKDILYPWICLPCRLKKKGYTV